MKRKQASEADEARAIFAADVAEVMSSPAGRRFVLGIIGNDVVSFSVEPLAMAFAEGQRSVRLSLKNSVKEFAVAGYLAMMREQLQRIEEAIGGEKPKAETDSDSDD